MSIYVVHTHKIFSQIFFLHANRFFNIQIYTNAHTLRKVEMMKHIGKYALLHLFIWLITASIVASTPALCPDCVKYNAEGESHLVVSELISDPVEDLTLDVILVL